MFRQSPGPGVQASANTRLGGSPDPRRVYLSARRLLLPSLYGIMYSRISARVNMLCCSVDVIQRCPSGCLDPIDLASLLKPTEDIKIFIFPRPWITCILD